jgi:hypothetical protein
MPFVAGGAAFANTKVIYRDSTDETPVAGADLTRVGVTLGAGLDWMFTRNCGLSIQPASQKGQSS